MKSQKQILSIIKAACAKEREAMKAGDAAAVERLDALTTLAADIVLTPEETSAGGEALDTAAYIYIEQAYEDTSKLTDEDKQTIIRDFKAGSRWQKEQQPAEWSAEDEEMLDAMIDIVSHSLYEPLCPREGMLAWLVSLRPYPHWKPSEEQPKVDYNKFEKLFHDFCESNKGHHITSHDACMWFWELGLKGRKEDTK